MAIWSSPGGSGGGTNFMSFRVCGGIFDADPAAIATWVGQLYASPYYFSENNQSYGTGADPVITAWNTQHRMPFSGKITDIRCNYRVNNTDVEGTIYLYKSTYTDNSSTVTATQLTSLSVPQGGNVNNFYELDTVLSSGNDISAGEGLHVFYKRVGIDPPGSATIYITLNAVLEF